MSQDDYEHLPIATSFDVQGRVIPNHTDLLAHLQHVHPANPNLVQRIVHRTQRTKTQNRYDHLLALKKLVQHKNVDQDIFPEVPRAFARNYFRKVKKKKDVLFINTYGVLCAKYLPSQRLFHERPCMVVMPKVYQHEIFFRAHTARGHQGITKVVVRIQERHTCSDIRCSVGQCVS